MLKLAEGHDGVAEHGFLSDLLEHALVFDGLNISELSCMEIAARRYQYWEQFYAKSLRTNEFGDASSSIWVASEGGIFLGEQHSKSLALICPALQEHVTGQLRESAALLKERRKAREERDASNGGPQPPKESKKAKAKAAAAAKAKAEGGSGD